MPHRRRRRSTIRPLRGRSAPAASSGQRATTPGERRGIAAVEVLAALAAVPAAPAVTGWAASDAVVAALLVAAFVEAASRSRRWAWMYLAGATTAVAPSLATGALGLLALALAFWATATDVRPRWVGAVLGALCSVVLLRLDLPDPAWLEALVVACLAVPVAVSGWRVAPRRIQRPARRASLWAAIGVGATSLVFGVAALLAAGEVAEGIDAASDGLDAARDGDASRAAAHLRRSEAAFDRANGLVGSWWAAPVRAVPVIGVNAEALVRATDAGAELTSAAARTAEEVDLDAVSRSAGTVDLQVLASFSDPLHEASDEIGHAAEAIDDVDGPLLLPPLRSRIGELRDRIDEAAPEAALAADVVDVAPALLGADGPRRYFVAFVQPAEARAGGGFMGNWAELTAVDGTLEMSRHGRVTELRDQPGAEERTLRGPADYVARYGRYHPEYWVQDVTLSPDFPSVAEVLREVYPDAGGDEIDGVLQLDPYALAALLEFTGPIEIDGYPRRLTSDNAAKVLLEDQYLEFSDRSQRADFLGEASRVAFEELLDAPLPGPRLVGEVMDPMVDQGRLRFWSFHEAEQPLLEQIGVDGALPAPTTLDFLSVRHQNSANNKIDIFLERSVRYDVEVDPSTGDLEATATVRLQNRAPASGLPDAVIGDNDKGLPLGTNQALVSIYTPHELAGARLDGVAVALSSERELGYRVYSTTIDMAAGASALLELDLVGHVRAGRDYELRLEPQALVRPDQVAVSIRGVGSWSIRGPDLAIGGGDGERIAGLTLEEPAVLSGRWRRTSSPPPSTAGGG